VVIGIDRGFLGESSEALVCIDAGVDRYEMSSEDVQEFFPGGKRLGSVKALMVVSPPKSGLILKKGGGKRNSIVLGNLGNLTELFHLKNPCLQGFRFLAQERRWSVRFDAWGWDDILNSRVLRCSWDSSNQHGVDGILLGLYLALELGELISQVLYKGFHVCWGMLGTTCHGIWVFRVGVYRAPKFLESCKAMFSSR
jgi:hypothetical protein